MTLQIKAIGTGPRSTQVILHTNDFTRPAVVFGLKWEGISSFGLKPFRVDFGDLAAGETVSEIVKVETAAAETAVKDAYSACRVESWMCNRPELKVMSDGPFPRKVEGGIQFKVVLEAGTTPGEFLESIEFKFSDCQSENAVVHVSWRVRPELDFVPKGLVLDATSDHKVSGKFIVISKQPVFAEKTRLTFDPVSFKPDVSIVEITGNRLQITFAGQIPSVTEPLSGSVSVTFDDQPGKSGTVPVLIRSKQ